VLWSFVTSCQNNCMRLILSSLISYWLIVKKEDKEKNLDSPIHGEYDGATSSVHHCVFVSYSTMVFVSTCNIDFPYACCMNQSFCLIFAALRAVTLKLFGIQG